MPKKGKLKKSKLINGVNPKHVWYNPFDQTEGASLANAVYDLIELRLRIMRVETVVEFLLARMFYGDELLAENLNGGYKRIIGTVLKTQYGFESTQRRIDGEPKRHYTYRGHDIYLESRDRDDIEPWGLTREVDDEVHKEWLEALPPGPEMWSRIAWEVKDGSYVHFREERMKLLDGLKKPKPAPLVPEEHNIHKYPAPKPLVMPRLTRRERKPVFDPDLDGEEIDWDSMKVVED